MTGSIRSRTRASAKTAGTRFERQVADVLAAYVSPEIDRRVKYGAKDRGDIGGLRHMGGRLVVEVKRHVQAVDRHLAQRGRGGARQR